MINIKIFEKAFNNPSFYILGAGASANIIPLTNQQGSKIVKYHRDFGVYSASEIEIDSVAKKLLGNAYYSDNDLEKEIINRIPSGAIKAISYQLMSARKDISPPSQYIVFNFKRYRSVIFNFNVDGLANRFCNKHLVLNAHGMLDPDLVHSQDWNNFIEFCLLYHINISGIPGVLLPEKEPVGITETESYKLASRVYPYTRFVVLIGYSFGMNGFDLDDWQSYEFFIRLFRLNNKPIIIISPNGGDRIAYLLCEDLKRDNIYVVSACWNYLASAIIQSKRMQVMFPHDKGRHKYSVEYLYYKIMANEA